MNWLSDRAVDRLRMQASLPDLAGTKYRIVRKIGEGGMGTVFEVEDSTLGRNVALKVLAIPDANGELAGRMLREAHILARLEHPGIIPIHDVGTLADGRVFYAMKLAGGQRLDRHIEQVQPIPERLRIFQRICEAVAFAHAQGILHRDLKPENVMVGAFGEVHVMDWGVAKIFRGQEEGATTKDVEIDGDQAAPASLRPATGKTAHGAVLGTPGYMSPEQARGETERIDERADVYALGALLRFLLTGKSPEIATTVDGGLHEKGEKAAAHGSAGAAAPKPLLAISAKAMASDPASRYSTAQELSADVARYLDGMPVVAYPEGVWQRAGRVFSKHRLAILLILTYLFARGFMLLFLGR